MAEQRNDNFRVRTDVKANDVAVTSSINASKVKTTFTSGIVVSPFAAGATLTTEQIAGGLLFVSAGAALQFPTAAALQAKFPNVRVGNTIRVTISAAAAIAPTITVNTGITIVGNSTIVAGTRQVLNIICTAVGATPTFSVY